MIVTKRAKRESDDQTMPNKMLSITNLGTNERDEELKLNEKPRSQGERGVKTGGMLEAEGKHENTETEKSDLFNRDLGEDDDDSEKRRERR